MKLQKSAERSHGHVCRLIQAKQKIRRHQLVDWFLKSATNTLVLRYIAM